MAKRLFSRWTGVALALAVLIGVGVQVAPTATAEGPLSSSPQRGVVLSLDHDSLQLAGEGQLIFSGSLRLGAEAKIMGLRVTFYSKDTKVYLNGILQDVPPSGTLERAYFGGEIEVYGEALVVFRRAYVNRLKSVITGKVELVGSAHGNWYQVNDGHKQRW